MITLELNEDELRLVVKLAEANDRGDATRMGRLGAIRTRTSLQSKLYAAKDSIDGGTGDEEEAD